MPIKATLVADVTDLRRGTEQAREEFRKTAKEAEGTSRALKAVGSAFDGTKLEGSAIRAIKSMQGVGGVTKLTAQELTQLEKKVTGAIEKFQVMGSAVPVSIQKVSREIAELRAHEEDLARSADKATQALRTQGQAGASAQKQLAASTGLASGGSALLSGLGVGLGAGAGLGAITAIGAAIHDIALDGARMAPLQQSFEKLQGGAVAANRELQRLRGETKGLVSDTDLMRQSNQASQLQLAKMGVDMGKLAGAAVTLGRAVGNDATASIDDLIGALGRGSTEVLDNLGITLKVAEAQEIYADRIHKTVAELTDQEKKQAFVTIGLERAIEAANALGEQQLTVSEQASRITTALGDMAAGMFSAGNQSVTLAGQLGGVADAIERIRNAQPGEVGDLIAGMLNRAGREAQRAAEEAERNAPWYLSAAASVGLAPLVGAGALARGVAPFIGDPNSGLSDRRTSDIKLPTMPSAAAAIGAAGAVAELNAAREALGKLTTAQRDAIKAAKELGASNKEAAKAAGTTENVVKLFTAAESGAKKATGAVNKLREEFEKLTGQQAQQDATRLADALIAFAAAGGTVPSDKVEAVAKQLMVARKAAFEAGEETIKFSRALNTLKIPSKGIAGLENLLNINAIGYQSRDAIEAATRRTGSASAFGGQINSSNYFGDTLVGMPGSISSNIRSASLATQDWRIEVRGVAQAFAQLAQIAGPAFGNVNRGIGTMVASLDASLQLVDSLADAFPKLGLTQLDAQGNVVQSGRGRAISGGLAALSTGATLGSMTSNPLLGGALGAGGGLATGALAGLSGAALGATAGIGAAAAIYMAWRNRQAEKKALSEQRAQVIASAGGFDEFKEAVEDAGFSFDHFLTKFNSNDADVFTEGMNQLNVAIAEQTKRASQLTKGLQEVARVQGVLSAQQRAQIRGTEGDDSSAAAIVEFAAQQRQQAEQGLTSAIAALNQQASLSDAEIEELTKGITDAAERQRVIEAALSRKATETLERFGAGAQGAAAGLFVAFSEAVAQGESALTVLARLGPSIQSLQQLFARGGIAPGEGFQQLSVDSEIATGPQTGPAVQLAQGLGQALAGFANSGLLSPELFRDLANGIGEAYHQIELLGKGGLEAARIMQPALQAIWSLIQDTPSLKDELDPQTLALVDFAEKAGLVGEKFRPAIDRMIDKIGELIDKIGDLINATQDVPPIVVPVTYEPGEFPSPPSNTGGGSAGDGTYDGGADGDPSTPFALGGIVTRPTHALIGEAGPEAVISLAEYRALLQKQLASQTGSARPWIGASANGDESARIIGRIEPMIAASTTQILTTLNGAATTIQEWAGRISATPLPSLRQDEPFTRLVSPITREREEPAAGFSHDGWVGRDVVANDGVAQDRMDAGDSLKFRDRISDLSEGIHRPLSSTDTMVPLSRGGTSSTPIQITVVSQIDGYEAARAITRHQPDVYRTYGAA